MSSRFSLLLTIADGNSNLPSCSAAKLASPLALVSGALFHNVLPLQSPLTIADGKLEFAVLRRGKISLPTGTSVWRRKVSEIESTVRNENIMETQKDIQNEIALTNPSDSEILDELIDLEEYAKANRKPPRAQRYLIRIDKKKYEVRVAGMTGRELLTLAGKTPVSNYMITQKLRGGQTHRIELDESADFTTSGVERFMTLPLDQTEG